jgi:hypothetical protein
MDKKILLIAMFYAPKNEIAAVRPTKLAKYLSRSGAEVHVITGDYLVPSYTLDPILAGDAEGIDSIRIRYSGFYYFIQRLLVGSKKTAGSGAAGAKTGALMKIAASVYDFLAGTYLLMAEKNWAKRCLRYVRRNFKDRAFDAVVSFYGPLSGTISGYKIKKGGYARRWISDFGDPPENHDKRRVMLRYYAKNSQEFYGMADNVVFVSDGLLSDMCENALKAGADCRDKSLVITNGFDPEDRAFVAEAGHSGKLIITYCGTIYAGRQTPGPLFEALGQLCSEGKIDPRNIEIHYAGAYGELFAETASGLRQAIVDHGYVNRSQSISLQHAGDIVLMLSWNGEGAGCKGILTGKFFETLLVERTVLCLVQGEKGSEIGNIIKSYRLGFTYEEAEDRAMEGLKEWLKARYDEKMSAGKIEYAPDPAALELYGYLHLAGEYMRLLGGE